MGIHIKRQLKPSSLSVSSRSLLDLCGSMFFCLVTIQIKQTSTYTVTGRESYTHTAVGIHTINRRACRLTALAAPNPNPQFQTSPQLNALMYALIHTPRTHTHTYTHKQSLATCHLLIHSFRIQFPCAVHATHL